MKRLLLAMALVLVIVIPALAQDRIDPIAGSPIGDTYARGYDYETGVALPEEGEEEMVEGVVALARTISLFVPATVNNGGTFSYSISYSPAISGTWTEQVIFNWPSQCEYLKEKTTRIKKFIAYGSVSGSSELVVVPSATCVAGTFEAKVIVTKGTNIWRAKASMEVINP